MRALKFAALLALGLIIAWSVHNRQFIKRYVSYMSIGADPLTVPVEWFSPTAQLTTQGGRTMPAADVRTIAPEALGRASDYAESQGSLALIVARHGRLEYEQYWQGFDRQQLFNPQSMSKTVLALLIGIAIADGQIGSVDDAISQYLPRWQDDPRGQISIENLLHMSGGLAQISADYRPVPWSGGVRQHFGSDFNEPIFALAQADAPGTRWDYNNNENNLLGLVLENATGVPYQAYLAQRLWQPLGLGPARMYLDREGGSVMKSCCILSRPIDWLHLGQLMLDGGEHNGQALVPRAWIQKMLVPAATNPGYGYQIWLGDGSLWSISQEPPAPGVFTWWASEPYRSRDIYVFVGHGYQTVWVIPSLQLVIVRATAQWSPQPWDVAKIPNILIDALAE